MPSEELHLMSNRNWYILKSRKNILRKGWMKKHTERNHTK